MDFGRKNCAGVQWTTQKTRVLSIRGIPAIEVEENGLGTPVTASFHVKVPPRHNAVFQVNVHGDIKGNYLITSHPQCLDKNPNVFQHEIAIVSVDEEEVDPFPLVVVTNLDHTKTLHIGKGEIVGFAKAESKAMTYIATANEINIEEYVDVSPKNWIPKRSQKQLRKSEKLTNPSNTQEIFNRQYQSKMGNSEKSNFCRYMTEENTVHHVKEGGKIEELFHRQNKTNQRDTAAQSSENEINHWNLQGKDSSEGAWNDINEVIESYFLISPGDIYPKRKVQLQDADISEETKKKFEEVCDRHDEAFSKNNKDIGRTQLIEMEIDTGNRVPLAQSPYTLPLKHYDWVKNEIEMLEKAGLIEQSLSPWASPVIVVPKKSAPDEPPRRRLCVDYRRVIALQQEIKRTDKGTGCLTLYPLPKIDEMFSKLRGASVFSTIDLRSGYYHIGLTRESRAKSAFVVPMGKWQFKRTPFGLMQGYTRKYV